MHRAIYIWTKYLQTYPRSIAIYIVSFGVILLGVTLFSALVPYNMDEFIHYDTIICYLYSGNNIHGTCDPFALNFLNTGLNLPLRAYHYSGSFPSLYYLPLHLLWNSPLAARMLGLGFLLLGGYICSIIFSLPWKWIALGMVVCFPYLFQHLVDTGPIGFHILSIFLLYALFDRWLGSLKLRYILCITLVIFCGIWTKFSYIWFTPGLLIIALIHAVSHRDFLIRDRHWCSFLFQSVGATFVLAILAGSLLLSTSPHNAEDKPYLNALINSDAYSMTEMLRGDWSRSGVVKTLAHPLEATQRIFKVEEAKYASRMFSTITYFFVPLTLLVLMLSYNMTEKKRLMLPGVLYISFILTVFMIVRTKNAGAMHHSILSYPFLILSILATCTCIPWQYLKQRFSFLRWYAGSLALVFILINGYFFVRFPAQDYYHFDEPDKLLVQNIVNRGTIPDRFVVLVVDWGMYYYSGLFGSPKKSVLFEWGLKDPQRIAYLKNLAQNNGRKLLVVYTKQPTAANLDVLHASLSLQRCEALSENAAWQILAEPDTELEEICASMRDAGMQEVDSQPLLRAALVF